MYRTILAAFLFWNITSTQAIAETWNVDSSHSQVGFEVDHMMISTVQGRFGNFTGSMNTNNKGGLTSLSGEVQISSVNTENDKRDAHLKGDDFFLMSKFPTMKFTSKKVKGSHKKGYSVTGDLTIRDVTKKVTLRLSPFKDPVVDGWGNTRVASTATTTINRQDFGVSWSQNLDSGGLVVSDDVRIEIKLEWIQNK